MIKRILCGIMIFVIWVVCRQYINTWPPLLRALGHTLGTGLPLLMLFELVLSLFRPDEHKSANPARKQYPTSITTAHIEQLIKVRSMIEPDDLRHFPQIRVAGETMPNVVPGAGIFTARIKRHGKIQNIVVMLATMTAVHQFEKLCDICEAHDFWAKGNLLPSRAGLCYSILFVTSFQLHGQRISF